MVFNPKNLYLGIGVDSYFVAYTDLSFKYHRRKDNVSPFVIYEPIGDFDSCHYHRPFPLAVVLEALAIIFKASVKSAGLSLSYFAMAGQFRQVKNGTYSRPASYDLIPNKSGLDNFQFRATARQIAPTPLQNVLNRYEKSKGNGAIRQTTIQKSDE